jgi:hypothetical protein
MGDHSNILIGNREASFGSNCDLGEWADYCVIEDGQTIGRMYEVPHAPADYRWLWSITEHVDPAYGIVTNGRVPTLSRGRLSIQGVRNADPDAGNAYHRHDSRPDPD